MDRQYKGRAESEECGHRVAANVTRDRVKWRWIVQPELSMGPFCVTRSNPTHPLTDQTQPNPLQVKKFGPNPTQPNTTDNGAYSLLVTFIHGTYRFPVPVRSAVKSNLTAWCNQIISNRAVNALTQSLQIFSTFATVDPTQPIGQTNPWPTAYYLIVSKPDGRETRRRHTSVSRAVSFV